MSIQPEYMLAQAARELRKFAHDIEQGNLKGPIWGVPELSLLEPVKTKVEIRDRTHQLMQEWLDRVVARAKRPTPDMLDQAQVFRQAANDLESGIIDCDEVRSVLQAFAYACRFDHRYRSFMKDTLDLLGGRPRKPPRKETPQ
jgi:hypothetical protein